MNGEQIQKSKKRTPNIRIQGIVSIFIIIAITMPIIPAHVEPKKEYPDTYWKHYPYSPPGTEISFPIDEGAHDSQQFPIEWWYVNFHLTGQTTGKEYGSFVAFYKIQTNIADRKDMRIFSISDLTDEKTYTDLKIGKLTACSDYMDLDFQYTTENLEFSNYSDSVTSNKSLYLENQEILIKNEYTETSIKSISENIRMETIQSEDIQTIFTPDNNTINEKDIEQIFYFDRWYTKSNNQGLAPFQYNIIVSGNSQQNNQPMQLNIDLDCIKKPLIVGGDGIIEIGKDQRLSYYYCLSKLTVTGLITLNAMTEYVTGFAWIDHQWGDFLNQNPPPYRLVVSYEWFSIKLNDNREIMVGDTWDMDSGEKINLSFSNGLNLFNNDETLELLENYIIIPESYWYDKKTDTTYSAKWHIIEESKPIDIIITPMYNDQMVRVAEEYPIIRQILELITSGACFWEGVCTVTGTINGIDVEGEAYVELTHNYNIEIISE